MQTSTEISKWIPSVYKINNNILFTTAYEMDFKKDTSYGKAKYSWAKVRVSGEFVSIMICSAKHPYRTKLTVIARRNDF